MSGERLGEFVECGGVLFRRRLPADELASELSDGAGGGGGLPLADPTVEGVVADRPKRHVAFQAVHHIVISAPEPPLEQNAALLIELLESFGFGQALLELGHLLGQLVYAILGLREVVFGHRSASCLKRNVVAGGLVGRKASSVGKDRHNDGGAASEDPRPDVGECSDDLAFVHEIKLTSWDAGMPRWRGAVRFAFAVLCLVFVLPLAAVALVGWAVRSFVQMVIGR